MLGEAEKSWQGRNDSDATKQLVASAQALDRLAQELKPQNQAPTPPPGVAPATSPEAHPQEQVTQGSQVSTPESRGLAIILGKSAGSSEWRSKILLPLLTRITGPWGLYHWDQNGNLMCSVQMGLHVEIELHESDLQAGAGVKVPLLEGC